MQQFMAFSSEARIFTAVISDGDALALPPGYMFTDMVSHGGACGIKLTYVHRGLREKLQSFFDQRSLYLKEPEDDILKTVLQDIFFFLGGGACLSPVFVWKSLVGVGG